jgi:3-hydroxypropionyl-coenzyme A dehydratase
VLNALNKEAMVKLSTAIDIVDADDEINVVIITGTGEKSFCAGADIRYAVNMKNTQLLFILCSIK